MTAVLNSRQDTCTYVHKEQVALTHWPLGDWNEIWLTNFKLILVIDGYNNNYVVCGNFNRCDLAWKSGIMIFVSVKSTRVTCHIREVFSVDILLLFLCLLLYPIFTSHFSSHMILLWNGFFKLSALYCRIPYTQSLLFFKPYYKWTFPFKFAA